MSAILIFDLDDTLVDTFGELIEPLERRAAAMLAKDGMAVDEEALIECLLDLRRKDPTRLYDRLREVCGGDSEAAVQTHRRVFTGFSVEALTLAPATKRMLTKLRANYLLALLTEGDRVTQQAKIDHLELTDLFDSLLIADPAEGTSKEAELAAYVRGIAADPQTIVVIGNRYDREIAAGLKLGTRTIWVRSGEGSEFEPADRQAQPDAVTSSVLEVPQRVERLLGSV